MKLYSFKIVPNFVFQGRCPADARLNLRIPTRPPSQPGNCQKLSLTCICIMHDFAMVWLFVLFQFFFYGQWVLGLKLILRNGA